MVDAVDIYKQESFRLFSDRGFQNSVDAHSYFPDFDEDFPSRVTRRHGGRWRSAAGGVFFSLNFRFRGENYDPNSYHDKFSPNKKRTGGTRGGADAQNGCRHSYE